MIVVLPHLRWKSSGNSHHPVEIFGVGEMGAVATAAPIAITIGLGLDTSATGPIDAHPPRAEEPEVEHPRISVIGAKRDPLGSGWRPRRAHHNRTLSSGAERHAEEVANGR